MSDYQYDPAAADTPAPSVESEDESTQNVPDLRQSMAVDDDTLDDQESGGTVYTAPERLLPRWNRPTDPLETRTPGQNKQPGTKLYVQSPLVPEPKPKANDPNAPDPDVPYRTEWVTNPDKQETERRLIPNSTTSTSFPSGFPTMPRQQDFQRSSQALHADLYPDIQGFTPLNPAYHVGTPDYVKQNSPLWVKKPYYPAKIIDSRDDDPSTPKLKEHHLSANTLDLVPFHERQRLARERGNTVKRWYYRPVIDYHYTHNPDTSDAKDGAEYVYEICKELERVHDAVENTIKDHTLYFEASMEKVRYIFSGLDRVRQMYNRSVYGLYISTICDLCLGLKCMRKYIQLDQPEKYLSPRVFLSQFKGLKDLIRSEFLELKEKCLKKPSYHFEIKKHAERLRLEPPNTDWQTENFKHAMYYQRAYQERGQFGYNLFDERPPSQSSSTDLSRKRLAERPPTPLQEKEKRRRTEEQAIRNVEMSSKGREYKDQRI